MIRFKDVPPSEKPKANPSPVHDETAAKAETPSPPPPPAPAKRGRPRKDVKPS